MPKYQVTSAIKLNGQIYNEGETVELTAKEAKGLHVVPVAEAETPEAGDDPTPEEAEYDAEQAAEEEAEEAAEEVADAVKAAAKKRGKAK